VESWLKKLILLLILVLCLVQLLLAIPPFRAAFCLVEKLEGAPVEALEFPPLPVGDSLFR